MSEEELAFLTHIFQQLEEGDLELLTPSNLQKLTEILKEYEEKFVMLKELKEKELEKKKLIEKELEKKKLIEDREKKEKLEQLLMDYARYLEKEPHEIAFAKIKDFFLKSK